MLLLVTWHASLFSCRLNHAGDGADDAFELRLLDLQLLAPSRRKAVKTRAAVLRGCAPARFHPAFEEHALQRGIERALLDLQYILGILLNRAGDFVSVQFAAARQRSQDQKVQCSRGNF